MFLLSAQGGLGSIWQGVVSCSNVRTGVKQGLKAALGARAGSPCRDPCSGVTV